MKSLIKLTYTILLSLVVAMEFCGCASTQQDQDTDRVSTIPWNRPQKWEGTGQLGGMMQ